MVAEPLAGRRPASGLSGVVQLEERRTLDPDAWRFEPSPRSPKRAGPRRFRALCILPANGQCQRDVNGPPEDWVAPVARRTALKGPHQHGKRRAAWQRRRPLRQRRAFGPRVSRRPHRPQCGVTSTHCAHEPIVVAPCSRVRSQGAAGKGQTTGGTQVAVEWAVPAQREEREWTKPIGRGWRRCVEG